MCPNKIKNPIIPEEIGADTKISWATHTRGHPCGHPALLPLAGELMKEGRKYVLN